MAITVEFQGKKYRRYPEAKRRADRVYYKASDGGGSLHRAIWEAAHGPIPKGHHVHHRDGNPDNNAIEHHSGVSTPAKRANLARIRPQAAAWHSTPEGRRWHQQHGRNCIAARPKRPRECVHCGAGYESISTVARFCSNKCKSAWRRAAGLDNVQRECACCAKAFTANRYDASRFCSITCANRAAWQYNRRL